MPDAWRDAIDEAHRSGRPVAEVLGDAAKQDAFDRLMNISTFLVAEDGESILSLEGLDFEGIAQAAEKLLQAASAAAMLGSKGELVKDVDGS